MSLGELKCPSLDYVYSMTWAEYCIRLDAFNRGERADLYKLRELMYAVTKAPHLNPKKIPKTIEKYFPLEQKKVVNSEAIKERIREATLKYKAEKNGG